MGLIESVGYLAMGLSMVCALPQAVKTFRTKSAGDLSLATLALQLTAHLLWVAYALEFRLWPVLAPNLFSLGVVGTLVWFKLAYDARLRRVAP